MFVPVNFVRIESSTKCGDSVKKGTLISFDGQIVWWLHFDDDFGIFEGALKIAHVSDYTPPKFQCRLYQ